MFMRTRCDRRALLWPLRNRIITYSYDSNIYFWWAELLVDTPAALCEVVATFFLLPATLCVDDVIFIETVDAAVEGKVCWVLLMSMCGWLMSSSKDMDPSGCFPVIGVSLDLGCGEAASLAGKLGFALCVTFGHILTALSRRRTPRTVFRDKDSGPWERVHIREFPLCTLLEFARSFEDGTL